jgi:hypothetical protein
MGDRLRAVAAAAAAVAATVTAGVLQILHSRDEKQHMRRLVLKGTFR